MAVAMAVSSGFAMAADLQIVTMGDSITAGFHYQVLLKSQLEAAGHTVTFVGTQGTAPNRHEGYSGRGIDFLIDRDPASSSNDASQLVTLKLNAIWPAVPAGVTPVVLLHMGINNLNHGLGVPGNNVLSPGVAGGYPGTPNAICAQWSDAIGGSFLNGLGSSWGDPAYGTGWLKPRADKLVDLIINHVSHPLVIVAKILPVAKGNNNFLAQDFSVNNDNCCLRIEELNGYFSAKVASLTAPTNTRITLVDCYTEAVVKRGYGAVPGVSFWGDATAQAGDWVHPNSAIGGAYDLMAARFKSGIDVVINGLASVPGGSGAAIAGLLIDEPFAYTAGTDLSGLSGGNGWTGGWVRSDATKPITVSAVNGSYTGLLTSGSSIGWGPGAASDNLSYSRGFTALDRRGQTTFVSFLMSVGGLVNQFKSSSVIFRLGNINQMAITAGGQSGSPFWNMNVSAFGTQAATTTVAPTTTMALVVVRMNQTASGTTSTYNLWIDPPVGPTPPSVSQATITSGATFTFDNIQLYTGGDGVLATMDEYRIGDSWLAVVPSSVTAPELDVSRNSTAVADGATDVVTGTVAGSAQSMAYVLTNSGTASLAVTVPVTVVGATNCTATVITQPGATIAAGATETLVVSVTPTTAVAWSLNLSVTNTDANENPYDWTVSGTASTVIATPVIVTQPASITVLVGQTATFTVTATGSSVTYQWRLNGVAIPGATAASFQRTNAQLSDSGGIYSVMVSRLGMSVTSADAELTVRSAPPDAGLFSSGDGDGGGCGIGGASVFLLGLVMACGMWVRR